MWLWKWLKGLFLLLLDPSFFLRFLQNEVTPFSCLKMKWQGLFVWGSSVSPKSSIMSVKRSLLTSRFLTAYFCRVGQASETCHRCCGILFFFCQGKYPGRPMIGTRRLLYLWQKDKKVLLVVDKSYWYFAGDGSFQFVLAAEFWLQVEGGDAVPQIFLSLWYDFHSALSITVVHISSIFW